MTSSTSWKRRNVFLVVVMSTIVVIKLSVTSKKYFLVFNNGSRVDPHGSIWIREGLHIQRFVKVFLWN